MRIATSVPRQDPATTGPRRHDLDALRAFAMLLGIVLHGALSFIDYPWAVQDQSREPALGLLVAAIHGFRMPLFFLLSGFFTAMLWRRRGLGGLLRHRARRILLPLVLAWVTFVPAIWGIWSWAQSGNTANTAQDIWTAAAQGDLDAVRGHADRGTSLDGEEPVYGQSPLSWAVIFNQQEVVDYLLDAGADPNFRYRDQNTALHTAAFFGRVDAAARLLDAGAEVNARNTHQETPLDSLRHDRATTDYIASLLQLPLDSDSVVAGRRGVRTLLEARGAVSGQTQFASAGAIGETSESEQGALGQLFRRLMLSDVFLHLWFLWFLCWLVAGFALVVSVSSKVPRLPIPGSLITTPLCLLWLVPLTMVTQSTMHAGGAMPGFGPDGSGGLVPIPHVLAHYAIFFGFGALLFVSAGANARLGRGWRSQLPLALLLLPAALGFALQMPWAGELAGDEATRRLLSSLGQALYVWLMIFGLMGLSETVLNRENACVRYVSDSSYWLYLAHFPLIIAGQAFLRDVPLPAVVKLTILIVVTTAILLLSYRLFVRYTWIGRLLNGPRTGARRAVEPTPEAAVRRSLV